MISAKGNLRQGFLTGDGGVIRDLDSSANETTSWSQMFRSGVFYIAAIGPGSYEQVHVVLA